MQQYEYRNLLDCISTSFEKLVTWACTIEDLARDITMQQKASIWIIACICLNIHALYENLTLGISWDMKTNYLDNYILKFLL